jgi:hypothetical protein
MKFSPDSPVCGIWFAWVKAAGGPMNDNLNHILRTTTIFGGTDLAVDAATTTHPANHRWQGP